MISAPNEPKLPVNIELKDLVEEDFSVDEAVDVWSKMADDSPPPPPEPADD